MKSKKFLTLDLIMIAVTGVIMLIPVLFTLGDMDVAYCLVAYYVIFPLAMMTCGCNTGGLHYVERALLIILAGLLGIVMPVTLLGSTKTITGIFGVGAAALGVIISCVIESTRK